MNIEQSKWTIDWRHLFITGDTNAGKTTLSRQIHEESHRHSIYWQPIGAVDIGGIEVYNLDQLKQAFVTQSGRRRKIVYRPHWDGEQQAEQFEELVNWLFRVAENTDEEIQFIVDEAHEVAPSGDKSSPLVRCVKMGRNYSLKTIALDQEPQEICMPVLRQSHIHCYLGTPNQYHGEYLDSYHVPVEELKKSGEHECVVLDEEMEVIERVEANPKYS